jgi:hypothetical protein
MIQADLSSALWCKSSYSSQNGNCVEIARLDHAIAVRDSKNPEGAKLILDSASWRHFLHSLKK